MTATPQRRGDPAPPPDLPSGRNFLYEWEQAVEVVQQQVVDLAASGGGGGTGSPTHVHTQAVAASVWSIVHTLGTSPTVLLVDGSGQQMFAEIHFPSNALVTVTHGVPYSGTAFLRA